MEKITKKVQTVEDEDAVVEENPQSFRTLRLLLSMPQTNQQKIAILSS